ncbi:glycosyltransferase family 61 protein [Methylobacterium organophilum]|uniref:Glycosyltransferase 61 catalytic domain-containing protein n=1 Tax=Methylobacterium organophilum TaxID=410 RepID=A0ABQ4TCU6_METOR|nr:glycosyltransferase family 61 protein [Methylobacterium organophilum]GJE29048.1 hypothetical protein LKMONMHP_3923 [Methylobacterium organophilum]
MARPLLRCTTLWGRADWIEAPPALVPVRDALLVPPRPEGAWGLFSGPTRIGDAGRDLAPGERLPEGTPSALGRALYLGPIAWHYGHFLLNTLPRLWPLIGWEGERPALLCHRPGPVQDAHWAGFGAAIFGRLGYELDELESPGAPLRLAEVLVPAPSLTEQSSVHAVFGDLCRAIGRPYWEGERQERFLYLSKTRLGAGIARIVNEDALEAELARRGVAIAHPETLRFPEQVRLLSAHPVVLGSAGSAFHTTAFAAPGRRVVGLNWQPALNANFALVDRVAGTRARYYHAPDTRYVTRAGFDVAWELPDPKGTAAALLRKAERLARDAPDTDGPLAGLRQVLARSLRPIRGR